MQENEEKLFLVRAKAENENRIKDFLNEDIIAIGWPGLPDLTGLNKDEITKELEKVGYSTSNATVGLVNHFVNNIRVGDLCLVPNPDNNDVYLCRIKSDYYYNSKNNSFPHTHDVEFLNKDNPFNRNDFSEDLNKALKPLMTVADVTHRLFELEKYMDSEEGKNKEIFIDLEKQLIELLPIAIENIKQGLNSDNYEKKIYASFEVIKLLKDIKKI